MIPEERIQKDQFPVSTWCRQIWNGCCSINHTAEEIITQPMIDDAFIPPNKHQIVDENYPPCFVFTQSCYVKIMHRLTTQLPEKAGVVFGPVDEQALLSHFEEDESGTGTPYSFELGRDFINGQIQRYKADGFTLKAIVHSHPTDCKSLSMGDLRYLEKLFGNPANHALNWIFMPIVCGRRMYPYTVTRNLRIFEQQLLLD